MINPPDIQVPAFLTNPWEDLLLFMVGLTLRLFVKSDKAGVRLFLYLLPLILRYIKRHYKSGYMHEKLSFMEAEISLLKKRLKHDKVIMLG